MDARRYRRKGLSAEIPCSAPLNREEIETDYEINTGRAIVRRMQSVDPCKVPGCLVANHGVFALGKSAGDSVHNAVVMEEVAKMAYLTESLAPDAVPAPSSLLDKHYFRKHGKNAYYGQNKGE